MSPILVRPVREQLEHDRVIRLLQNKLRKKYVAEMNPGDERNAPVKLKGLILYPDLLLTSTEAGRKVQTIVEVETGESLNHLEVMSQWVNFSKAKGPFHLYVPVTGVDVAKRLMAAHGVEATELWSYLTLGDKVRFVQVLRSRNGETVGVDQEKAEVLEAEDEVSPARPAPAVKPTAGRVRAPARARASAPARAAGRAKRPPLKTATKSAPKRAAKARRPVARAASRVRVAAKPKAGKAAKRPSRGRG